MKIKHCSLLILFTVSRLFLFGQTDALSADTTANGKDSTIVYKGYFPQKSMLQLSVGGNVPVGSFGRAQAPFVDGFASIGVPSINWSINYYKLFKNKLGFCIGLRYMTNEHDYSDFRKGYLNTYGDTGTMGIFFYENFTADIGVSYYIHYKKWLITANAGSGILYTVPFMRESGNDRGVQLTVTNGPASQNHYEGGNFYRDKKFSPLVFAGLDIKYLLNGDMYITGNMVYTSSYISYRLTETESFPFRETDYQKGNLAFSNLAFCIGVGTIFR